MTRSSTTPQNRSFDLGAERNEPIGHGYYQAPRQAAPNTGPPGDVIVRIVSDLNHNLAYPTADELVVVTLTAGDMSEFTVRIENVSHMSMFPEFASPITPVFWIVESHHMMADDEMAEDDDMMMMGDMMMDEM
ncbi:MAG: hypothetical protein OXG49_04975 [Chloroflexi bacterium]|nr:hypothetical protein [Chloroflexota bacterium]